MKIGKILGLAAGIAAVAGAAWYLTKKKKSNTVLYSQEFDEALDTPIEEPIEEPVDEATGSEETKAE